MKEDWEFLEFLENIFNNFYFQCVFKLLLILILAGLIGFERNNWNKPAGFRTHSLVGLSAVLMAICGEYLFIKYNADPSRISAQLLSGIGFIGAGTILRDGFNVKGLTTAASLLAVTCVGLCIGLGFFFIGILATVIIYIVLSYSYLITDKLDHFMIADIIVGFSDKNQKSIEQIQEIFEEHDISIKKLEKSSNINENEELVEIINFTVKYNHNLKLSKIVNQISNLDSVCSIERNEQLVHS